MLAIGSLRQVQATMSNYGNLPRMTIEKRLHLFVANVYGQLKRYEHRAMLMLKKRG